MHATTCISVSAQQIDHDLALNIPPAAPTQPHWIPSELNVLTDIHSLSAIYKMFVREYFMIASFYCRGHFWPHQTIFPSAPLSDFIPESKTLFTKNFAKNPEGKNNQPTCLHCKKGNILNFQNQQLLQYSVISQQVSCLGI